MTTSARRRSAQPRPRARGRGRGVRRARPGRDVDEIARRAGVGHGTVFRRFPTKDGLARGGLRAAARGAPRPRAGAARRAGRGRRVRGVRLGRGRIVPPRPRSSSRASRRATASRRSRPRKAGAARGGRPADPSRAPRRARFAAHVDARDVGALVGAAIQAAQHAERDEDWRRYVQVVLDGLRALSRAVTHSAISIAERRADVRDHAVARTVDPAHVGVGDGCLEARQVLAVLVDVRRLRREQEQHRNVGESQASG